MPARARRPSPGLLIGSFAAAILWDLLAAWPDRATLLAGGLRNPDSYVRLIRLRASLAQGRPDFWLTGDSSGAGTEIHWSHLLDAILLLLAAPLRLWPDPAGALHAAGLALGPLGLGLLAAAAAWAVAPLAAAGWRWLAPLALVLAPGIQAYAALGVVHHHIPLALAGVLTAGFAGRAACFGGRSAGLAGLSAGFGLWLSPEALVFAAIGFGALAVAWALAQRAGDAVVAKAPLGFAAGLLGVVGPALLLDPPLRGLGAVEFDRLSLPFLVLALLLLLVAAGWRLLGRLAWGWQARVAAGLALGLAAAAAWLGGYPALLEGTAALMSAEQARAFFDGIREMMPVTDPAGLIALLLPAAAAAVLLAGRALGQGSLLLGYTALCGAGLVLLSQRHARFVPYAELFAALALPVLLGGFGATPGPAARLARAALLALFLLVAPLAALLPAWLHPEPSPPGCSLAEIGAALAGQAGQVVLASPNDAPELLYRSPVRTVGSLYHRGIDGFMRLRAAWRSDPSPGVPPELRASGATLVLICPGQGRLVLLAGSPADTLLDRLNRGEVPPWLVQLPAAGLGGYRLYRVVEASGPD